MPFRRCSHSLVIVQNSLLLAPPTLLTLFVGTLPPLIPHSHDARGFVHNAKLVAYGSHGDIYCGLLSKNEDMYASGKQPVAVKTLRRRKSLTEGDIRRVSTQHITEEITNL